MDPSNQQICVGRGEFRFSQQSDLTRKCDHAAEYILIPASFMYKGSSRPVPLFGKVDDSPDYIHVTIGPGDRAITSGHPIGSAGISQGLGGGGTPHSDGDGSPSLCGKVSCWDQFAQALSHAVAQNSAANANSNPPPPRASTNLAPPPAAAPPQRPRPAPIMVGKADVSNLAGLFLGDTREYVSYFLGPPASDPEQDSSGFGGYPYRPNDGLSIRVNYDNNLVTSVKVYSKGSRVADPLLNLLGKSESAAVALLGAPQTRESLWDINNTDLVWSFPVLGRPAESRREPQSIRTLTLHFRTGVGCESISLIW